MKWLLSVATTTLFFFVQPPRATAQIQIFNIADGDVAGLRAAMSTANADGKDDIINLATNGTYTFSDTDSNGAGISVEESNHTVSINGRGATFRRANGAATFPLILCGTSCSFCLPTTPTLAINNLTVNGNGNSFNIGVFAASGQLNLKSVTITQNQVDLYCVGSVSATDCTFTGGVTSGVTITYHGAANLLRCVSSQNAYGIINNGSTMTVTDCTIAGNTSGGLVSEAGCFVGAIGSQCYPSAGTTTVSGSLFSGNNAGSDGGAGILNEGTTLTVINSTFANNTTSGSGGGLNNSGTFFSQGSGAVSNTFYQGVANLTNCTFSINSASAGGGAIATTSDHGYISTTSLVNTILRSGSTAGGTLSQTSGCTVTSQGHNISDEAASGDGTTGPGGFLNASGDMRNTDPRLLTTIPQDNGGPTKTLAIGIFGVSPAINNADPAYASRRDQRGEFRTGAPDIGAYEYNGGFLGNSAIAQSGSNAVISVEVSYGHTYQLQRKLNLTDSSWQSISGLQDLTATGSDTETITAPGDISLGKAFYKVVFEN